MKNEKEMKNFADNVVWLRNYYKLSKREMALIMGIGVNSLNKIEKGNMPKRMSVKVIFNIYNCFKITSAEQLSVCLKEEKINNMVEIDTVKKYLQKLYL